MTTLSELQKKYAKKGESKQAPVPKAENGLNHSHGTPSSTKSGGGIKIKEEETGNPYVPWYLLEAWKDLDASIASVFAKWPSKLTSYRILKEWLENGNS